MATLYTHKDSNIRKTYLFLTLFFIFNIMVGFVFSVAMDDSSMLYFAVFLSLVMSFSGYFFSDKVILFMSRAKEIDPKQNKEIYRLVENLCITAGLPLPKVYIIESDAMNAFATGRNPKNAVIALTSGLINKLEKAELEGVIAHELSHVGNRDILLSTLVVVMVGFATILADWFRHLSIFGGRRRDENDGQIGAIIMIFALVFSILSPLIAVIIQLAISRRRELLADADAGLMTRYPEGLARALEKISHDPHQLETANSMTSHLYISDPMKKKKHTFFKKLFMTHPPVEERVKALRDMEI